MEYFFIGAALLPYVVAAVLGLLLPTLLVGAYSNFGIGLWVVGAAAVLDNLNQAQPILRLGLTLYPADLPMVIIGLAGGLRWLLRSDIPRRHWAWVLMATVFFANLAVGMTRFGTTAGVQARPDFYAIAAATYAMSFEITEQRLRQMLRTLFLLAISAVLISFYRWTVFYLPITELLPPGGVYNSDGEARVVASNYALMVAQVLVLGLFFHKNQSSLGWARWLSPVLFAVVLVLQHRSVWLAALVGVFAAMLLARTQRAPLWQQMALLMLVAVTTIAPLMVNEKVAAGVQSSATTAVTGQGTVGARVSNWRASIEKWAGSGPRAIVMGNDLGSDPTRTVEGQRGEKMKIRFHAHNMFVNTLTNFGVVGLCMTIFIIGYALAGLWRLSWSGSEAAAPSALLLVLLATQLTYYVAYGVDFVQYFVLGVAVSWVAGRTQAKPAEKKLVPYRRPALSRVSGRL